VAVIHEPAVQELSVGLTPDDAGNVVIAIHGEVDIANADQVQAALVEALTESTGQVVVDIAGVSFLDSQCVAALIRVHKSCDIDSERLTIRSPQPQARRVFELTGLHQVLRIELTGEVCGLTAVSLPRRP
jgi:anti-anti-sigma factor